jgi:hypothetical protein
VTALYLLLLCLAFDFARLITVQWSLIATLCLSQLLFVTLMTLLYGLWLESLSFRSMFTLWTTGIGSGLARQLQHNDVICGSTQGPFPVFFSIYVRWQADGRALGSFQYALRAGMPWKAFMCGHAIVVWTEDLMFVG